MKGGRAYLQGVIKPQLSMAGVWSQIETCSLVKTCTCVELHRYNRDTTKFTDVPNFLFPLYFTSFPTQWQMREVLNWFCIKSHGSCSQISLVGMNLTNVNSWVLHLSNPSQGYTKLSVILHTANWRNLIILSQVFLQILNIFYNFRDIILLIQFW